MFERHLSGKKLKILHPKNIRIISIGNNMFQIEYGIKILFWYYWKSQTVIEGLVNAENIINTQILNNTTIPVVVVIYTNIKVKEKHHDSVCRRISDYY